MSAVEKMLLRFANVKVIEDACRPDDGPLLIRYKVMDTKPLGTYLHHLLRSDHDRALHDHPWTFISFLLGSYIEHTESGAFRRRRFSILFRPAEFKHRLELQRPVWSVVFRLRCRRIWGFWLNDRFVAWNKYLTEGCGETDDQSSSRPSSVSGHIRRPEESRSMEQQARVTRIEDLPKNKGQLRRRYRWTRRQICGRCGRSKTYRAWRSGPCFRGECKPPQNPHLKKTAEAGH